MSGGDERVQAALAAHLEHAELGGPPPDTSHLTDEERGQLAELIELLDATEGVGFGRGMSDEGPSRVAATPDGERIVAALRDELPPGARITEDTAARPFAAGASIDVAEGFIVGTFGGRVRVWLLGGASTLAGADAWIVALGRAFRAFADTAAIALVEPDGSCLLVVPEDCAPRIEVPRGILTGRRYRRPVGGVGEVVAAFVRELVPHWEPMLEIGDPGAAAAEVVGDVGAIARERAAAAVDEQVAAGGRARKTNPKRKALTELGDADVEAVVDIVMGLQDGRLGVDELGDRLERMAER